MKTKTKKPLIIALIIAVGVLSAALALFLIFTFFITGTGRALSASGFGKARQVTQTVVSGVTPDKFAPQNLVKVGNHIVYEEDFFERCHCKEDEKKAILSYFPKIDKQLTDDVCLSLIHIGDGTLGYDYRFGFYQVLNGAVIDDTFEEVLITNGKISIHPNDTRPFVAGIQAPDSQYFAPINDICDIVETHCEAHKSEMTFGKDEPLNGTYILKYGLIVPTQSYGYYYYFTVNEYSHIKIDPYSGDVYEEYYWNGVYVD